MKEDLLTRFGRAKVLVAEARYCRDWLGNEGERANEKGASSSRKTAEMLMRKHGWSLDQLDGYFLYPVKLPAKYPEAREAQDDLRNRLEDVFKGLRNLGP